MPTASAKLLYCGGFAFFLKNSKSQLILARSYEKKGIGMRILNGPKKAAGNRF